LALRPAALIVLGSRNCLATQFDSRAFPETKILNLHRTVSLFMVRAANMHVYRGMYVYDSVAHRKVPRKERGFARGRAGAYEPYAVRDHGALTARRPTRY